MCVVSVQVGGFLSTLSLRRATSERPETRQHGAISIHALLAESDPLTSRTKTIFAISIHALLAESDVVHALKLANAMLFLSTLSLRRATLFSLLRNLLHDNFYPRSPCGERRGSLDDILAGVNISIHALLAESDGQNILGVVSFG